MKMYFFSRNCGLCFTVMAESRQKAKDYVNGYLKQKHDWLESDLFDIEEYDVGQILTTERS